MSIESILNAPTTGLIPYLDSKLGGGWGRHQIKPWGFNTDLTLPTSTVGEGFRLRDVSTEVEVDTLLVTQRISVGRVITVVGQMEAMLLASQLRRDIDWAIHRWGNYCCPDIDGPVDGINGAILGPQQDKAQSAERDHAWAIAVIRDFAFSFREGLEL